MKERNWKRKMPVTRKYRMGGIFHRMREWESEITLASKKINKIKNDNLIMLLCLSPALVLFELLSLSGSFPSILL